MRAVLIVFCVVFLFQVNSQTQECHRLNEELSCVTDCPPEKTCRTREVQFYCLSVNQTCQIKCVCKKGFYKNPKGDCISDKQCEMCPGKNEYYSCGSACDNECATLHEQNQTNCPIVNIKCNEKCYCDEGYARDAANICVPIEQCPKTTGVAAGRYRRYAQAAGQNCGPNEVFNTCTKSCPPETCISLVAKFKCDSKELCKPACVCKPGFLRLNEGSECMQSRQCPQLANSPDFKKEDS